MALLGRLVWGTKGWYVLAKITVATDPFNTFIIKFTLSYWQTITFSVSNNSPLSMSLTSSPEFNCSYKTKYTCKFKI